MSHLRCATLEDLAGIRDVSVRNGLSAFEVESRKRWWLTHPFAADFEGVPMGWVLEDEGGRIVGTLTNIPMLYELDGRSLRCATASSWAVDPEHRSRSLQLMMSYFAQGRVELMINGSANDTAAQVMLAFRAEPIPAPEYDASLFWILRPRQFAAAALQRRRIPAARWLSVPAGLLLWLASIPGRLPRRSAGEVRQFERFGEEFDAFWERLRKQPGRLRAVRTAKALEWRFSEAWWPGKRTVLGVVRDGELQGYIVLAERDQRKVLMIGDLQALDDSPMVIRTLLGAAIRSALRQGALAVQWLGWAPGKRRAALPLFPTARRSGARWPLYYRTADAHLKARLSQPHCWDFSPFDAF
ncbi:MAG: GNAT family N-acetyltransferase [Bryobacterales bacterium]|nr:GNAT family N-acetyltransferase [Bryobacteraceae bacterium]MDW8354765.1 GNAT family N-acetyltransferase [Bryobacterales bacterium]